jgi:hypothetical protein
MKRKIMKNEEKTVNKFQPMGRTKQIKGSILTPENAGLRFILSVNNTQGKPEGNPLLPLFDKKWKKVREESRGWFATKTGAYKVGAINTTAVQSDTWVIHMLCQGDDLQVDLKGLEACLVKVAASAKYEKASVHVSNLLTTNIPQLTKLLNEHVLKTGVSVYFYEE